MGFIVIILALIPRTNQKCGQRIGVDGFLHLVARYLTGLWKTSLLQWLDSFSAVERSKIIICIMEELTLVDPLEDPLSQQAMTMMLR
nr:hypothetical protein Iba_chr12cCG22220 [Ipomoea batatas]